MDESSLGDRIETKLSALKHQYEHIFFNPSLVFQLHQKNHQVHKVQNTAHRRRDLPPITPAQTWTGHAPSSPAWTPGRNRPCRAHTIDRHQLSIVSITERVGAKVEKVKGVRLLGLC
jgi:hypothetical protein